MGSGKKKKNHSALPEMPAKPAPCPHIGGTVVGTAQEELREQRARRNQPGLAAKKKMALVLTSRWWDP